MSASTCRHEFPIWEGNCTQHSARGFPRARVLLPPANGPLSACFSPHQVKLKSDSWTPSDALTQSEIITTIPVLLTLQFGSHALQSTLTGFHTCSIAKMPSATHRERPREVWTSEKGSMARETAITRWPGIVQNMIDDVEQLSDSRRTKSRLRRDAVYTPR